MTLKNGCLALPDVTQNVLTLTLTLTGPCREIHSAVTIVKEAHVAELKAVEAQMAPGPL